MVLLLVLFLGSASTLFFGALLNQRRLTLERGKRFDPNDCRRVVARPMMREVSVSRSELGRSIPKKRSRSKQVVVVVLKIVGECQHRAHPLS